MATPPAMGSQDQAPSGGLQEPSVAWLGGLTVLVDGSSISLGVAGRVLSQFGASVTVGSAADATADIVLVDRIAAPADGHLTPAAAYLDTVARTNTGVWVTASAYGLTGGKGDLPGSEMTVLASGGILGHSRVGDDWAPTVPPGSIGLKMVGYVMAVAALHAAHEHLAMGAPVHVDLSAQAAIVATGLTLEMAHALEHCPDQGGSARYGAPSGFFQCVDGSVYVLVIEEHQWQAARSVLEPALDTVATLADARTSTDHVNELFAAWASTRTARECEQTLQAAGVPATAVNSIEVLAQRSAEIGRPVSFTGDNVRPLPARITAAPHAPGAPSSHRGRLSTVQILDAGHVLAVPLGSAWLGAMGATVTKLEDPDRLDVYRRRGPFAGGQAGLNRSAYFNQLNFSKQGLDVAVGRPGIQLDLEPFDVVLHNLTPRRARTVGVDQASVLAQPRPKLAISSSGFGGEGAWAGYRAYGHNIHAFAGLVAATKDARGEMGDVGTPWADPLTSVVVAAWVLAWAYAADKHDSVGIDISMAELTAVQLVDFEGTGPVDAYASTVTGGGFFVRTARSDQMVAVTLNNPDEVRTFERIVGSSLPQITVLGQLVEIAGPEPDELVRRLAAENIAGALVATAHDLANDPFLRGTGLFRSVTNRDLGTHDVTGLPWRFIDRPAFAVTAAPERPPRETGS